MDDSTFTFRYYSEQDEGYSENASPPIHFECGWCVETNMFQPPTCQTQLATFVTTLVRILRSQTWSVKCKCKCKCTGTQNRQFWLFGLLGLQRKVEIWSTFGESNLATVLLFKSFAFDLENDTIKTAYNYLSDDERCWSALLDMPHSMSGWNKQFQHSEICQIAHCAARRLSNRGAEILSGK